MSYTSDTSQLATLKTYGKSRYTQVYGQNDDFDKFFGIEDVQKTTFISPEATGLNKKSKNVKNSNNKMKTFSEWLPSKGRSTLKKKNYGHSFNVHFNKKDKKSHYSYIAGNSKVTPTSNKKSKKLYNFHKQIVSSTPLQKSSTESYGNKFTISVKSSKKKKIKSVTKKNLGHAFNTSYSLEVNNTSVNPSSSRGSSPTLSLMINNKHRLIDNSVQISGSHYLQPMNKKCILKNDYITNAICSYDKCEVDKYELNLNKPSKLQSSKKKKTITSKENISDWYKNTMDILQKNIQSSFDELHKTSHSIEEITTVENSFSNQDCESVIIYDEIENSNIVLTEQQKKPSLHTDLISNESLQSIKNTNESPHTDDYFSASDRGIKCSQSFNIDKSKLSNNSLYVSCYQHDENNEFQNITNLNVTEDCKKTVDRSTDINHTFSQLACNNPCTTGNVELFEVNKSCLNLDNSNVLSVDAFDIESPNDFVQSIIDESVVFNEKSLESVENTSVVFYENSLESLKNINLDSNSIVCPLHDSFILSNITNMLSDVTIDQGTVIYKRNILDSKENTIFLDTSNKDSFKTNSSHQNDKYLESNIPCNNDSILDQTLHTSLETCEYLDNMVCHFDSSQLNVNVNVNESINSDHSSIVIKDASIDFDNISAIKYKEDTRYGDQTNILNNISDELQSVTFRVSQNTKRKRYASRFSSCINSIEKSADENQMDFPNLTKTFINCTQSKLSPQKSALCLEPGKKWRRSLMILERSNILKNSISYSSHTHLQSNSTGLENEIAKKYILEMCNQEEPVSFDLWLKPRLKKKWKKVGEGLYSEAFSCITTRSKTVVKIIPVEGKYQINNERQKMLFEVYSELLIATELTKLSDGNNNWNQTSSFCNLKNLSCVIGKYPEHLISLWTQYADNKGTDNDNPNILPDDQMFMVLEMEDGGTNVEEFEFKSAIQALFAFVQLVFGLAVAEHHLNFEHRDLHTGNILVKRISARKHISFTLDGEMYSVPSHGIKITIIDFTLSRITHYNKSVYNDLSVDFELFNGVIDETSDYQFHIYPLMREETKNKWDLFKPKTNIYWLHYVLDKMLTSVHYKNSKQSIQKTGLDNLKMLKDAILSFNSAKHFAESDLILNFVK